MPTEIEFLQVLCISLWSIFIALIGSAAVCAIICMFKETMP